MALVSDARLRPGKCPVVSVCIANYNGGAMLVDCIDSVLMQDCQFEVEILVHDDASTDASLAMLRSRYPQVHIIASEENVGFCISNNRMVAQARGDYVLLLNNDAALFQDALSVLHGAAMMHDGQTILTLPQHDWDTGEVVDRGCRLDPFYNPVPNLDAQRGAVAYVIGACLWCPRALWNRMGGFPAWIESIGEDLFLCCQARLAGGSVLALPHSGYRHRQGASFGGNRLTAGRLQTTYRRRRLSERNKTFALLVFTPSPLAWALLTLHLALLLSEGVLLSLIKRDWRLFLEVYWNVPASLARRMAQLRRARCDLQRRRTISAIKYFGVFTLVPRKLSMLLRHGLPSLR